MVNLEAIEKGAQTYIYSGASTGRTTQERYNRLRQRLVEREPLIPDLIDEAAEILKRLQVEEALNAIREEAWHGGQVSLLPPSIGKTTEGLSHDGVLAGIRLVSEPFPIIKAQIRGYGIVGWFLRQATSCLTVSIPVPSDGQKKIQTGEVKDGGIYQNYDFTQLEKDSSLWRRSVDLIDLIPSGGPFKVNSKSAQNALFFHLNESLVRRKEVSGFPWQLKRTGETVLNNLPPELQTTGKATWRERREWLWDQQGRSGLGRTLQTLLNEASYHWMREPSY